MLLKLPSNDNTSLWAWNTTMKLRLELNTFLLPRKQESCNVPFHYEEGARYTQNIKPSHPADAFYTKTVSRMWE